MTAPPHPKLKLEGLVSIGQPSTGGTTIPIFKDDSGALWTQVSTSSGSALVPWIGGLPTGSGGGGGHFVPSGHLPHPGPPGGHRAATLGAMVPSAEDAKLSSEPPREPAGPKEPLTLGTVESQVLKEAFRAAAAGGMHGEILQNTIGNLPNLANIFASSALGRQTMKLFGGWGVDEETSAPEIVLQQQAKGLAMKAQGVLLKNAQSAAFGRGIGAIDIGAAVEGLKAQVVEFFSGVSSSATLAAAHLGIPDDKGNTLVANTASTVLVEGKVLGVVGGSDTVVPAGKPVVVGAGTVFAKDGALPVARATSSTAAPSALVGGATTVLVGGTSVGGPLGPSENKIDPKTLLALTMNLYSDGKGGAVEGGNAKRPGEGGLGIGEEGPTPRLGKKDEGKPLLDRPEWTLLELMDSEDPKDGTYPDGYRAGLFRNEATGETVFIPQGTNFKSADDWFNNFAQGLGFIPPQYEQALADAQRFKEQYPGLTVTGHSLGGGLATYAGTGVGAPVVAFNPAGLGTGTIASLNSLGVTSIAPGQVTSYVTSGEILTGLSTWFGQPAPVGNIYELPMAALPGWDALGNHQTSVIWDTWNQLNDQVLAPKFTGTTPLPVLTSWSPYGQ